MRADSSRITLHFSDIFMHKGIEKILEQLPPYLTLPRPVAIFDAVSYYAAIADVRRNTVCIMVCGEQPCRFLPLEPTLYRVSRRMTPGELIDIISTISDGRPLTGGINTPFMLDENEKDFLTLFFSGAKPEKISCILGLHVKTIYIIRNRVMNKLSCRTLPELTLLCQLPLFRHWFCSH